MKKHIFITTIALFWLVTACQQGTGTLSSGKNTNDNANNVLTDVISVSSDNETTVALNEGVGNRPPKPEMMSVKFRSIVDDVIKDTDRATKIKNEINSAFSMKHKPHHPDNNILDTEFVKDTMDFDLIKEKQLEGMKTFQSEEQNKIESINKIISLTSKDERTTMMEKLISSRPTDRKCDDRFNGKKEDHIKKILKEIGLSDEQIEKVDEFRPIGQDKPPMERPDTKDTGKFHGFEKDFIEGTIDKDKFGKNPHENDFEQNFERFKSHMLMLHKLFTPEQRVKFIEKMKEHQPKDFPKD